MDRNVWEHGAEPYWKRSTLPVYKQCNNKLKHAKSLQINSFDSSTNLGHFQIFRIIFVIMNFELKMRFIISD